MVDNENTSGGLGGAFGSKTKGSQISYGHPYSAEIIESAMAVIGETETGRLLMRACKGGRIPIHIIKGNGQSGFSPQARVVYIQIPGKQQTANPVDILMLVKAMREADQDLIGLTTPDPMKDIMNYAAVMHTKNIDAIIYTCKVVKELTNSSIYTDLLDGLGKLGYSKVYSAFSKDASNEEIVNIYAEV